MTVSQRPIQDQIAKGRRERDSGVEYRIQRYRVKAAVMFTCQHEGCAVDWQTRVVNLDGSEWTPDQERSDEQLTVRCRAHRKEPKA